MLASESRMSKRAMPGRIAHLLSGATAVAAASLCVYEASFIGFPDGYVSDFDGVYRFLLVGFGVFSAAAGSWFGFLGLTSQRPSRLKTVMSYATYLVIFALVLLTAHLCYLKLDHGQGG